MDATFVENELYFNRTYLQEENISMFWLEDREDYNVDKELKETTNIIEKNDVIVAKRNDTMVETIDKDEGNRMVVNLNWRYNSINLSYNQSNSISPKIPIETSPNHFTNSKTTGKDLIP